jgi:hypothetical protein
MPTIRPFILYPLVVFILTAASARTARAQGIYYNTPESGGTAGTVQQLGIGTLVGGLTYPTGLAFDGQGNLYFGNSADPLSFQVMERSPAGTVTTVATFSAGGSVALGPWAYSIAVSPSGGVFYNTPTYTDGGTFRGEILEVGGGVVVSGLSYPTGLTFDSAGNLYFVNVTGPASFQIMELPIGTTTPVNVGSPVSVSGSISFGAWTYGVAVSPSGSIFYNTPKGGSTPGTIQELGVGTVVNGLAYPTGLAFDAAGNLYFGDSASPANLQIMELPIGATTATNVGSPFNATGSIGLGLWAYGLAVQTPTVTLVDPVPQLIAPTSPPATVTDPNTLATSGRTVSGVAADGVTELVLRISASNVDDQLTVSLFNDQGKLSTSSNDDGALGNPGDASFSENEMTLSADSTSARPMAFAVYRAPIDFPRASGQDASSSSRFVSIQVADAASGVTTSIPIRILRPPVILVPGLWSTRTAWNDFAPLYSVGLFGTVSADSRFSVTALSYDIPVGSLLSASQPSYKQSVLASIHANSLGFQYNANIVFAAIANSIGGFKNGANLNNIQVAAVQADVVAHSLGGDIIRYLALLPQSSQPTLFARGNVHKVVTLDTPHLGSPLATALLMNANSCTQGLLAYFGDIAVASVTFKFGPTISNGAVGDLSGAGTIGGALSPELTALMQEGPYPIPTALIAGETNSGNEEDLDSAEFPAFAQAVCGDPLAIDLSPSVWDMNLFDDAPNDAIVPLSSQLDGLPTTQGVVFSLDPATGYGYIHSLGTEALGFFLPSVDTSQAVSSEVIDLLNTPINNSQFNSLSP